MKRKLIVSLIAVGALSCFLRALAADYTWDSSNLTGDYLSPTSWGLAESATFSPVSTDKLYFNAAGGVIYQPTFAANAGKIDIYGQWQIQNGATLRLAVPSGTSLLLSGENVGTDWFLGNATLDIAQGQVSFGTPPSSKVRYGRAGVYRGSRLYVHGEGTSFLGLTDSSETSVQPGLNLNAGRQDNIGVRVYDGATISNFWFRLGDYGQNCVFEFSGENTLAHSIKFNNISSAFGSSFGYFTNGVTIADSTLPFSGTNNTVVVEDAFVTNSTIGVAGNMTIARSRFVGIAPSFCSQATNSTIVIKDGTQIDSRVAWNNFGAKGDSEMRIEGADVRVDLRTPSMYNGILTVGTGSYAPAFKNYQTRLTVTDGASLYIGAVDSTMSLSSNVGLAIGGTAGYTPANDNEVLIKEGAVVTNMSYTYIGGGFQANAGSNNRLIISNATYYGALDIVFGGDGSRYKTDASGNIECPSTNNVLEVLDGATMVVDQALCLNNGNTNQCGGATCRVRNATLQVKSHIMARGADSAFGAARLEVGGTNGYMRIHNIHVADNSEFHTKFIIPAEGKVDDKPYLDVVYTSTMSIPERGMDLDLAINNKWAQSGRKNYLDLMRISRGGSGPDFAKQSDRLTTLMNSISSDALNGCTLSIVTNEVDTAFDAAYGGKYGTFVLRLHAGPQRGILFLVR